MVRGWGQPRRADPSSFARFWARLALIEMRTPTEKNDAETRDSPSAKRSYAPPVLSDWGTLTDITATTGVRGNRDGAGAKSPLKSTRF